MCDQGPCRCCLSAEAKERAAAAAAAKGEWNPLGSLLKTIEDFTGRLLDQVGSLVYPHQLAFIPVLLGEELRRSSCISAAPFAASRTRLCGPSFCPLLLMLLFFAGTT